VDGSALCICRGGFSGDGQTCTEDLEKCIKRGDLVDTGVPNKSLEECRADCIGNGNPIFALECPTGSGDASCLCFDIGTWDSLATSGHSNPIVPFDHTDSIIPFGNCEGRVVKSRQIM